MYPLHTTILKLTYRHLHYTSLLSLNFLTDCFIWRCCLFLLGGSSTSLGQGIIYGLLPKAVSVYFLGPGIYRYSELISNLIIMLVADLLVRGVGRSMWFVLRVCHMCHIPLRTSSFQITICYSVPLEFQQRETSLHLIVSDQLIPVLMFTGISNYWKILLLFYQLPLGVMNFLYQVTMLICCSVYCGRNRTCFQTENKEKGSQ